MRANLNETDYADIIMVVDGSNNDDDDYSGSGSNVECVASLSVSMEERVRLRKTSACIIYLCVPRMQSR